MEEHSLLVERIRGRKQEKAHAQDARQVQSHLQSCIE